MSFVIEKETKTLLKVAAPLLLVGIFYRSTSVIERALASSLETGSISYPGYANQMMVVLSTIASGGVATTIYPVMAKYWGMNNFEAARSYFSKAIRILLLTTLPIAAIVLSLGRPIIEVLLQRGAFNAAATQGVSRSLMVLMPAFICLSLGNVIGKGFYLSNRTKIFSAIVSLEAINYLCCGYVFIRSLSYLGLAAASSISTFVTTVISFYVLNTVFHGIDGRRLLRGFFEIAAASICMGLAIWIINELLFTHVQRIVSISVSWMLGLSLYAIMVAHVFRINEALILKEMIANRILSVMQR